MQATLRMLQKIAPNILCQFIINFQRYDPISAHVPNHVLQLTSEKP